MIRYGVFLVLCALPISGCDGILSGCEGKAESPQRDELIGKTNSSLGDEPGSPGEAESPELASVHEAFDNYKAAVLQRDAAAAAALVSRSTLDYYSNVRDLALYASGEEMNQAPIFTEMQALILRQLAGSDPSPALSDMTISDVVVFAFERRIAGTDIEDTSELKDTSIEEGVASSRHFRRKRDTGSSARLVHESGEWRVDLTPFFDEMNVRMDELGKEMGRDPREYGLRLVEAFTQRPLEPESFDPPLERGADQLAASEEAPPNATR